MSFGNVMFADLSRPQGTFPSTLNIYLTYNVLKELTEIGGRPCKVIGRSICWPYRADGLLVAASLNGTRLPVTARSDRRPSLPGGQQHCVPFFLCENASSPVNA